MRLKSTFFSAALAATLLAGSAVAQTSTPAPEATPTKRFEKAQRQRSRQAAAGLNLTDAQKQQIRELRERQRGTTQELRAETRQLRTELQAAMKSGDTAKVETLSQQLGVTQGKLRVAMVNTRNEIRSVLTPEQQTQFDQLRESRGPRTHRSGPRG